MTIKHADDFVTLILSFHMENTKHITCSCHGNCCHGNDLTSHMNLRVSGSVILSLLPMTIVPQFMSTLCNNSICPGSACNMTFTQSYMSGWCFFQPKGLTAESGQVIEKS